VSVTVEGRWNFEPTARPDEYLKLQLFRFVSFQYEPQPCRPQFGVERVEPPKDGQQTVAEAHEKLWRRMREGKQDNRCETCGRDAVRRPRALTARYADFLVKLAFEQLLAPGSKSMNEVLGVAKGSGKKATSDGSYLSKWGLVEKAAQNDYKISIDGLRFVAGDIVVPYRCLVFDNKVYAWSTRFVCIDECVGDTNMLERVRRMMRGQEDG
jgi:hypothetical protein